MNTYDTIIELSDEIYHHFSEISRKERIAWDLAEGQSQLRTLYSLLENISKNVDEYSSHELKSMLKNIVKAQREITKLF